MHFRKLSLMSNDLVLFISNIIVLFSNVLKAILCMILYRNQIKLIKICVIFV